MLRARLIGAQTRELGNTDEAKLRPRTIRTIGFQRTTRDSSIRESGTNCSNHLLLGGTGRTLTLSSPPPTGTCAGTCRKWAGNPGKPYLDRAANRKWVGGVAEVVGERSAGGGGSRSTVEPDVCRALTGVAEGAVPDHGKSPGQIAVIEQAHEKGKSLIRSGEALRTRNLGEVFQPATN
ncbi:uncharacterized protein LOC115939850 [Leptonychotes weddellii]|uniref:Uncharacterized protein LOC115939850 n=1 Tax=Leptonychotes weddellii TaxID=9713 RepID=A0A7F8QIJ4_LEPWE|nr:uncharacterized protein LOC115939850 [Leptonychotes weddellii]